MDLARLRAHMDLLATDTWERIVEGDRRGLRFREDSFSENHLYDLDRAHPGLYVRRFNQVQEHRVGADWEWWIGERSVGWFCIRIQAKRVEGQNYDQLDHSGELPGEYQYDTLIRTSNGQQAYPYYVFFNGFASGWPSDARWSVCPNDRPPGACSHHSVEHFGCAIVPASLVKKLHVPANRQRRRAARYLSYAQPWSHLFDPVGASRGPVRPVKPHNVFAALHSRHRQIMNAAAGDLDESVIFFADLDDRRRDVNSVELPAYAQAIIDGEAEMATDVEEPDVHLVIVTDLGQSDSAVDDT